MTPSTPVSPHALRVASVIVFTIYALIHARCEWNLHKRKKRDERRGFPVTQKPPERR
jgi:hypothetical protein